MIEPRLTHAGVRDGGEEWHIECRMDDGQKGAFIVVDREFEKLAHHVADLLNEYEADRLAAQEALDDLAAGGRTYTMEEVEAELDALEIEREKLKKAVGTLDDDECAAVQAVVNALMEKRRP